MAVKNHLHSCSDVQHGRVGHTKDDMSPWVLSSIGELCHRT
jgi:hypothetical protein